MEFLSNNALLVATFVFSGIMLVWSFLGNKVLGIKEVEAQEALQLINHRNAQIVDVRENSEFAAGHILNAKHIPLGKLTERIGELEKFRDKPLLMVCRSGNRSGHATRILNKEGFTQVFNLAGGVIAWQKANLPLEK